MRVDITTTRKKYRVIYADPPWKFSSKEVTGKTRGGVISTTYKPLEAVYPTMTTEALKELDVGRIAHRDAALFMWATDAHIPDALELYRAWGFRYVTRLCVVEEDRQREDRLEPRALDAQKL